jgi:hypothetical protein
LKAERSFVLREIIIRAGQNRRGKKLIEETSMRKYEHTLNNVAIY